VAVENRRCLGCVHGTPSPYRDEAIVVACFKGESKGIDMRRRRIRSDEVKDVIRYPVTVEQGKYVVQEMMLN
jgi:hypothetical protein